MDNCHSAVAMARVGQMGGGGGDFDTYKGNRTSAIVSGGISRARGTCWVTNWGNYFVRISIMIILYFDN